MLGRVTARRSALRIRRCCACGYGGHFAQIQAERAEAIGAHCPRCGCDFAVRPPRSYAEMEGLDERSPDGRSLIDAMNDPASALTGPTSHPGAAESALVERWLAFSFAVALTVAIALYVVS